MAYQDILNTCPDTEIIFGTEAWQRFATLLEQRKAGKIVVFSGRNSADKIRDIEAEPCTETIEKMTAFLKRESPDEGIALGGGSPMDAAKAAYLERQAGQSRHDFFRTK